ncbi:hypothetical protein JTB14_009944 [Gonioctena quinquepunctata]|nr:hypothetical protein JTB14_009944 [Gonioctena quinquepunctata]
MKATLNDLENIQLSFRELPPPEVFNTFLQSGKLKELFSRILNNAKKKFAALLNSNLGYPNESLEKRTDTLIPFEVQVILSLGPNLPSLTQTTTYLHIKSSAALERISTI